MENGTNAFHKTYTDNKDVSTIFIFPKDKSALHARMPFLCQQSKTPPLGLPEATCTCAS
jgi:hypothetical protein